MKQFKLLVGLADYTIKFKKKVLVNKEPVEGVCDWSTKSIQIDSSNPPDIVFTTFWHEWTHAVLAELGAVELAQNEPFVESLSQNIARAVRHIPSELK
jgi:hypothetical protein